MNEVIEFIYMFDANEKGEDSKHIVMRKGNDLGVHADEICEMFVDFMRSAGFSEQNIYDYFKE